MNIETSQNPQRHSATIDKYFEMFRLCRLDDTVACFADDAIVKSSSNNFKEEKPIDFYTRVFDITKGKAIKIRGFFVDTKNPDVTVVCFDYDLEKKDGDIIRFHNSYDCFELDPKTSKIKNLTITLGTGSDVNRKR